METVALWLHSVRSTPAPRDFLSMLDLSWTEKWPKMAVWFNSAPKIAFHHKDEQPQIQTQ